MNKYLKIIILAFVIAFLLYAIGGKFIASILEPSSICHSSSLYESKQDGFFRTFYELDEESKKIMDSLHLKTDTIWAEKTHGYEAGYFGKYHKKELHYLSIAFPVQNILDEDGYLSHSLSLNEQQRRFTSGYETQNNRYNFSPKYLEDTLFVVIKKRDGIVGWRKSHRIGTLTLVRQ